MRTGTITFLFTDIEASTPLWEGMPQAMKAALSRHNALLRQSIEANAGIVFKIVGDSFQTAFNVASHALSAALAAQRALAEETWGETGPLRVRMGLHTGLADPVEDDYATFRDGLELSKDIRFKRCVGSCIRGLAGSALGKGNLARSTRLFGAGEALIKITGSRYHGLAEKAINERNLMILRARLDEKAFMAVWQEGNNMSLEEAIAYALEDVQAENRIVFRIKPDPNY